MEHLDCRGLRCPEPLIRCKLWLAQARVGQRLCLSLSDAASMRDIVRYLARQEHLRHECRVQPWGHDIQLSVETSHTDRTSPQ